METLIAIIDDDISLQGTLTIALKKKGYKVVTYSTGAEAILNITREKPNLIILDIMMPLMDGINFCKVFRSQNQSTPIIFLSSRNDEVSKIEALQNGGDDYVIKPFSLKELLVRIEVCLRRSLLMESSRIMPIEETSPFQVNKLSYELRHRNKVINLTVTEFRIFTTLYDNKGIVFTRDQLMNAAYPNDAFISDRNIDAHITRIRRKIERVYPEYNDIESVYGVGYKYV
ncbi:response regulator transcription factor [Spirochaeta cellobiosiphila]|uniref:response regulator transcription factor n=1 Tax=Spirochaeta cellobiosiphila TaxID=504483 RepID=UPI00041C5BEE|nr:response regulator transcription factor [Spirochaeta cellobiosiphila]